MDSSNQQKEVGTFIKLINLFTGQNYGKPYITDSKILSTLGPEVIENDSKEIDDLNVEWERFMNQI
jgi:hypothetical protein